MSEEKLATTTLQTPELYPDYPTVRLTNANISTDECGMLILPDGPWTKNNTDLPTAEETAKFNAAGYAVDSQGRPLHPWLHHMLENGGVVTGKGFYYNWGPNYTADPVVLTNEQRPSVLLIKRNDNGMWALPGGFIDPGETNPADAARRELFEEANLKLDLEGDLIYQAAVADARTTANAWAETSAYAFIVNEMLPVQVTDPHEVNKVEWFYVDELPLPLHGSHEMLIMLALEQLDTSR